MRTTSISRRSFAALTSVSALMGAAAVADDRPLVVAIEGLSTEVFSPLVGNAQELHFMGAMSEVLVYREQTLSSNMQPGLAESWTVSEDGLVYTFNLRKVNFHDGSPFTAADVIYTFNLIGAEDSRNPRRYVVGWVEKMEEVDPHTLRITLKERQNSFIRQLSNFAPYFPILSKAHFERLGVPDANRQPMGTGPYRLVEHNLSESIILEATDAHWRKTPDFPQLEARIVPDEMTRISMLRAGEADVISISAPSLKHVEEAGFKIIRNPGAYFLQLGLGGQVLEERAGYDATSPWASKEDPERARKVRQALCMAVNMDEIREKLLYGVGQPFGVQQFIPGTAFDEEGRWPAYAYDPEAAKALLAEAGYANGFDKPIVMYVIPDMAVENKDISEAIAMAWERVGLKVERRVIDTVEFRRDWIPRGKMQVMGSYVLKSTPLLDPLDWYSLAASTTGSINQLFESHELSALVDAGLAENDEAKAQDYRRQVADMVHGNYMSCPVALMDAIYAVSDRVEGWGQNVGNSNYHNLEYIESKK